MFQFIKKLLKRKPESVIDESLANSHWFNGTTGVRHNTKCKFYGMGVGFYCSPTEGVPCKKCGG